MLKVGCCGFPTSMREYFKRLSLVEVQRTFYSLPSIETTRSWREQAPENFEFTAKAWQLITHPASSPTYRKAGIKVDENKEKNYGFFKPTEEVFNAWTRTSEITKALEANVVIFQCPASFTPIKENMSNMRNFFSTVDRGAYVFAWEPRGEWDAGLVKNLCEELDLVHCVDPLYQEPVADGKIAYLRLHGGRRDGRIVYDYKYTEAELKRLAEKCRELVATKEDVYCLFNNMSMLEDATKFRKMFLHL